MTDDKSVHLIGNFTIHDAGKYRIYEKGVFSLLKRHGGRLVAYDDQVLTFEGSSPREGRMVILKFESERQAAAWYTDPDYQALSEHRRAGTDLKFLTLVHGH